MNGLTKEEVRKRVLSNKVNYKVNYSRSIFDILVKNICTLFNLINLILFVLVLTTGSYYNCLFALVIVINTVIAIVGEVRAKLIIDRLDLNFNNDVTVIRDRKSISISCYDIVIDDVIVLKSGDTAPVDCVVLNSNMCEVDESIITGEDVNVIKKKNDKIMSGSIIVSGSVYAKVVSVGKSNYASLLIKNAKSLDSGETYLQRSLNRILKIITILIVPVMLMLFITSFVINKSSYNEAILYTTAGIIGMIPSGLVLLSSIALSNGVINLAKKNVVVQKLNGIEALASVDVLCLDKTGTITSGQMEVFRVINKSDEDVSNIIKNMISNNIYNQTDMALDRYFKLSSKLDIVKYVPFSSYRKYSMVSILNKGTYGLGALEYMISGASYDEEVVGYINDGYRVLTLVHSSSYTDSQKIPSSSSVICYIILKDCIRPNVKDTLGFFKEQGVRIKIISGDSSLTVSNIMKQVGSLDYKKCVDCSNMSSSSLLSYVDDDYFIFARCNPYQKRLIINRLKDNNTVGMIGDGVNDILALKEADCSISLTSNSNASKSVSQMVLCDNDFDSLPSIVNEGRRVINNIERVSSLYLVKTIYSCLLSILCIILRMDYPFYPVHLTLISSVCVGLPSLFLTLIKDYRKVSRDFIRNSFKLATSGGISVVINVLLVVLISKYMNRPFSDYQMLIVCLTGFINLFLLYRRSKPLNVVKGVIFGSSLFLFVMLLICFKDLFFVGGFSFSMWVILFLLIILDVVFIYLIEKVYVKILYRKDDVNG